MCIGCIIGIFALENLLAAQGVHECGPSCALGSAGVENFLIME